MNTKQIILIFITFFIAILVLTIPFWLDRALPILKNYLNFAIETLENWYSFLKFISGQLEEVFSKLLKDINSRLNNP